MVQHRCLNCGEPTVGRYCHACGQATGPHNRSLWLFIQEFLDEFLKLDSKFLRTIVPLVIKPGYLTKQWVAGKRTTYITPLKLYVALSALCFLAISLVPNNSVVRVDTGDKESLAQANADLRRESAKPGSSFEKLIQTQVSKLTAIGPVGDENRKEFADKFVGRLSTANLLLLPIFALLFKLLYIRRSRFYVEHLVFALHYYAFFSFAMALIVLSSLVSWLGLLAFLTVLWVLAYLPVAMVVNYQQGIIKSLVKCAIFCGIYMLVVSAVLVGMVLFTAMQLPAVPIDHSAPPANRLSPKQKPPLLTP